MTVDEILQQVANLGLNEDRPDEYLLKRHCQYLNNAYREVWRLTQKYAPHRLLSVQGLQAQAGQARFDKQPGRLLKVFLCPGDKELPIKKLQDILCEDPCLTKQLSLGGTPDCAYLEGRTIHLYPSNNSEYNGTIFTHYVPEANVLMPGQGEDEIKISPLWHDMLVDGALYYLSYDERDLRTIQEINLKRGLFDKKLKDYQHELHTRDEVYTIPYEDF